MKIVRFATEGKVKYGVLDGNTVLGARGRPYALLQGQGAGFKTDSTSYKLKEVKLLAPCLPSKIVAIGLNYHAHAQEFSEFTPPKEPLIFLKPSTCVIGPDDTIIIPKSSVGRVDYECELAVVIGKKAKDVTEDKANDYILGYTCANDVTERVYQKEDGQWTRAKGFDTFGPLGPWIVTGIAADNLKIETYVNGQVKQSSNTSNLIFGVPRLLSFISRVMTLLPGDVISTGTPGGIGRINPGDVVEVKIEKVGTLRNHVAAAE
ncbi:MAG: fumarylacetoacetate hydrolase family protein [Dehalococcoidales bacterium]|nr:fumarylacetoacetate hydrolase family protein [Dehalococcoidales bacterium]